MEKSIALPEMECGVSRYNADVQTITFYPLAKIM